MDYHRLDRSLERFRPVGSTVASPAKLPRHLVADEKHTTSGGQKVHLAATTGSGRLLGIALAQNPGNDDFSAAHGQFRNEARCLDPTYRPEKKVVREKVLVLALCGKKGAFVGAYSHPGCHRTSNLGDRRLRRLDDRLFWAQHLQGSTRADERGGRGGAGR